MAKMRRAIDLRPDGLKQVLLDARLRKTFLNGAPKDAAKVVKALAAQNQENALKTQPRVSFENAILFANLAPSARRRKVYIPERQTAI